MIPPGSPDEVLDYYAEVWDEGSENLLGYVEDTNVLAFQWQLAQLLSHYTDRDIEVRYRHERRGDVVESTAVEEVHG